MVHSRNNTRGWRALSWLLLLSMVVTAEAQVNVSLQIKRRTFLVHEPVIATVTIVNQTGKDVMLADTEEGKQWFSFAVVGNGGRTIPARNPDYELQPLPIRAGETVKRSVNLNELYELGDVGSYRATASIFIAAAGKWFSSRPDPFDLTEGRVIWKQTAGDPDAPDNEVVERTFTLLTLEQDKGRMLYVRVVGESEGIVFGCYNLGRILEGYPPDAKFDSGNNLAILQATSRREYLLSRIGIGGNFVGQQVYTTTKGTPRLRKLEDGTLQIVGATRQEPVAKAALEDAPKLSDRPPGFPASK
jgi:hypothetical protein